MIEKGEILQAVKALRSLVGNYEASGKKRSLLQEDHDLYLQVTLNKIPKLKLMKRIYVTLPHRLFKDTDEVCLIVGDLDKKDVKADVEQDILHYKELLEKHGIKEINEVVTLRQLRTEYKQYEAKQKLLAAYDIFITDNKITECLPKALSKHFFKKRKFPIQINIHTPHLKKQIERALSTKVFQVTGHGNCCTCEVAYLSMKDSDIVDNIVAMAETLSVQLPGSWNNVKGLYLKTSLSKAIPLYVSYDDPNEVQIDEVEDVDNPEIDELSTFHQMNVKVFKDGRVEVLRVKDSLQEFETKTENGSLCESVSNEEVREKVKSERNSEESSLENINAVKNEFSHGSPAEDMKKSIKSKKRKSQDCSLEDFISVKKECPSVNPEVFSVEYMKKTTKSKKRKLQDLSLMKDSISVKKEFSNDSPADVSVEDVKKSTKSKKTKSLDISLKDSVTQKSDVSRDSESVKKVKKGLKSKKEKAQECSLVKNAFPHENGSVEKTKKSLKSKRRKDQECSPQNVISEKKKKNKGKRL